MLSSIHPNDAAKSARFCSPEASVSQLAILGNSVPFGSAAIPLEYLEYGQLVSKWHREITIREWTDVRIAIDTGGTFTDCVYLANGELRVLKVFSTPDDPSLAVTGALTQIGAAGQLDIRHGTTVGTNTMLERTGARVAFVTTAGFEETIAIGRQARSSLYDWFAPVPVPIVPRELRFGVPERVGSDGAILRSPTEADLAALVDQVHASGAEAIAISLLFSFANPETELRVEAALRVLDIPVST